MTRPFDYIVENNEDCLVVDYRPLVRELVHQLSQPIPDIAGLSRRFHSTIVDIICEVCLRLIKQYGIKQIVLSGGVFCNEFILVNTLHNLEAHE